MNNFQVGALNANKTTIASGDLAFKQDWKLDQLGNWEMFKQNDDGIVGYELDQDRTVNAANEITGISQTTGPAGGWANPVYDAAGNMTEIPQADTPTDHYDATYDAWNRLVKLEDPGSGAVVATYEYNGVNHRIRKTVDPNGVGDTYDTYYNTSWQALEVRKPGSDNPYEQFVYDGSYIDAPFMRYVDADTDGTLGGDIDSPNDGEQYYLRDASFNVIALLDAAGTALERYRYTPYGQRVVLDADFTPAAGNTTAHGQQRGFQGLRHDEESGFIENRSRMLDPTTGRFVQRDPLGYPDGMNAYAAYHVMCGGGDPTGRNTVPVPVTPDPDRVPDIHDYDWYYAGICRGISYNRRTHVCCGGLIYAKNSNYCCKNGRFERCHPFDLPNDGEREGLRPWDYHWWVGAHWEIRYTCCGNPEKSVEGFTFDISQIVNALNAFNGEECCITYFQISAHCTGEDIYASTKDQSVPVQDLIEAFNPSNFCEDSRIVYNMCNGGGYGPRTREKMLPGTETIYTPGTNTNIPGTDIHLPGGDPSCGSGGCQ